MQHTPTNKKTESGGYILLLTVLIISIFLAIGLSIYALSIKEFILASFLRESERALATADRALECALYWDRSYPQNGLPYTAFATSTTYDIPSNINVAVCDGTQLSAVWTVTSGGLSSTTTYPITYANGTCADVEVAKFNEETVVTSNGYNMCDPANSRRTQRTIQVNSNI